MDSRRDDMKVEGEQVEKKAKKEINGVTTSSNHLIE